jgi:hypothetical protein
MERGGDLNDGLQEGFVWLVAFEPDSFPVLMGSPELLIAIATQAVGECTVSPVKDHGLSLSGHAENEFCVWKRIHSRIETLRRYIDPLIADSKVKIVKGQKQILRLTTPKLKNVWGPVRSG